MKAICTTTIFFIHFVMTSSSSRVTLDNQGRYSDVVIAIDESVPQSEALLDIIKRKFTSASQILEAATRREQSGGLSFKTIHILLPDNWNIGGQSTQQPQWQRFDIADILVHHSTDISDLPSTLQTGGCGSSGEYSRYTDYYFLNENLLSGLNGLYTSPFKTAPEKMIVHQWAHYRWGVFDEYPTEFYPNQFYSLDGKIEPVKCSQQIQGEISPIDVSRRCEIDRFTNSASENCRFIPNNNGSSRASLMFAPQNQQVVQFCDSNVGESDLKHSSHAPNHHNEMCGGDSVWEVMRRHSDFRQNYQQSSSTIPQFKLIQRTLRNRQIVMVMDVSGSMSGNNLATLKSAAKTYIENILESTAELALVKFSDNAYTIQGLTRMNSQRAKQTSVDIIQGMEIIGGTNIPSGLARAFEILGGSMSNPESYNGNGFIMLISDGKNGGSTPYPFDETIQILQRSSVIVDSISIGSHTDDRLKNFAERTGGKYFKADPNTFSTTMIESFISTVGSTVKKEEKVSVVNKGKIPLDSPSKVIATIDAESGQDTTFVFKLASSSMAEVIVYSPSNVEYKKSNGQSVYTESNDGTTLTVTVKIPGVAESGEWRARVVTFSRRRRKRSPNSDQDISFVVITKPKKNSTASLNYVGKIDCGVIYQADTNTRCPCTMVITNHGKEILNANVTMVMTSPGGLDSTFPMLDNGIGSDITAGDGVYTASVVGKDLTEVGIYNIKAEIKFKLRPNDETFIHRIETLGGLKVNSAFKVETPDTTPPDQIRKVTVDVVDMRKRLVRVSFIAVGDDGDREKASIYQFKLNDQIMNGTQFDIKPSDPGTEEEFLLQFDKITENMNTSSFFLYIRAVDDANNEGKWSMGYPITFEKVKFVTPVTRSSGSASKNKNPTNNKNKMEQEVSSPKSYRVEGLMNCPDIIPPTWNYRCIVKVNVTDKDQPVDDARVTLLIIDPAGNKKMLSMNHNTTGSFNSVNTGIYTVSIIGRDFTIKGYYNIIANATFYIKKNKVPQLVNESIPIGFQNCAADNPGNQVDEFPPDQIQMISAEIINKTEILILLKFFAVGDDGDRLKAENYEFRVNGVLLNESNSNSTSTRQPGEIESIIIMVDPVLVVNSSLNVNVRAKDLAGNVGQWSKPVVFRQIESKFAEDDSSPLMIIIVVCVCLFILIFGVLIVVLVIRKKKAGYNEVPVKI